MNHNSEFRGLEDLVITRASKWDWVYFRFIQDLKVNSVIAFATLLMSNLSFCYSSQVPVKKEGSHHTPLVGGGVQVIWTTDGSYPPAVDTSGRPASSHINRKLNYPILDGVDVIIQPLSFSSGTTEGSAAPAVSDMFCYVLVNSPKTVSVLAFL